MKKIICLLLCAVITFGTFNTIAFAKDEIERIEAKPLAILGEEPVVSASSMYDEVRILVTFIDNAKESAKKVKNAIHYEQLMQNIYLFVFEGDYAAEAYESFKNDPNVKSVSFDAYVGIDPLEEEYFTDAIKNNNVESASLEGASKPNDYNVFTSQWYLDDVGVYDAWQVMDENFPDAKDNSVVVAVIDSGIDTSCPDLQHAILTDENGDYIGFNTLGTGSTSFEDDYTNVYHGTAVSSFIAAKSNNNDGICGIAGDYNVKILPIKALNSSGSGAVSSIIKALDIAIENNADIVNMSLSSFIPMYILSEDETEIVAELGEAINIATQNGICVVAAAGNYYSNYPLYPASYDNVLSVAAYSQTRERAEFSQYNDYIDIAAPGRNMAHLIKTQTDGTSNVKTGSGTSYSAPLVSATAALLKIAYPEITPQEISNIIKISATDLGKEGYDQFYGHGALDVEKAVESLANLSYRPITKITIPESINLKVGEHKQIETSILPVYASNKKVRYESYDTSVATVSNNGVVYGVGIGAVDIAVIPDDTEEVYYTTVYVEAYSTAENDGEYSRQTGTPLSKIDILDDEFLFYSGEYIWHGEADLIDKSAVIKPTMSASGDYTYCAALPKNKENTVSAMYAYTLFNSTTGKFTFSNSPYFPKGRLSTLDEDKKAEETYIDFANDGKDILALTSSGRIAKIITPTEDETKCKVASQIPTFGGSNIYLDKISFISDEKSKFYIGAGFDESKKPYIIASESGYDGYGSVPFGINETNKKVKHILIDGHVVYFLTDDALYCIKTGRNSGQMAVTMPEKMLDIDASDIKELMFVTQDDKKVLAGVKNDNSLCVIASDGAVIDVNTDMENITHLFSFLGDVYTVNDGVLKTTNIYMFAKNKSLAPEFLSYDVNILDKNNKLVSSPTTDGKFTVEYQIESIAPITFDNEKYSTTATAQNKYPAQVVFAVYERITDRLVDIKMRDFLLDYYYNKTADIGIGALLRWEEKFNLGAGNYYIKVMTFKGNNFYWPERNNSTETLDVFTHQYKK